MGWPCAESITSSLILPSGIPRPYPPCLHPRGSCSDPSLHHVEPFRESLSRLDLQEFPVGLVSVGVVSALVDLALCYSSVEVGHLRGHLGAGNRLLLEPQVDLALVDVGSTQQRFVEVQHLFPLGVENQHLHESLVGVGHLRGHLGAGNRLLPEPPEPPVDLAVVDVGSAQQSLVGVEHLLLLGVENQHLHESQVDFVLVDAEAAQAPGARADHGEDGAPRLSPPCRGSSSSSFIGGSHARTSSRSQSASFHSQPVNSISSSLVTSTSVPFRDQHRCSHAYIQASLCRIALRQHQQSKVHETSA